MYDLPVYDRPFDYAPPNTAVSIIAETDDYILVDKPADLLSVPGKKFPDCMEARVKQICSEALTIHRLDMATSGLMIFAKTKHAQRHLGLQFERRQLKKTYLADIATRPTALSGRVNLPIWTDWPNRPRQMIDFEKGRRAVTDWTVHETAKTSSQITTRLSLHPVTGRSHQLRLHMAILGQPLLGDRLYAPDPVFQRSNRLHLHAFELCFREPSGGEWVKYQAPCPF
jgi:tRNA pseudouridine32 synthase/23S rRNA pseudouridine746 synthase